MNLDSGALVLESNEVIGALEYVFQDLFNEDLQLQKEHLNCNDRVDLCIMPHLVRGIEQSFKNRREGVCK